MATVLPREETLEGNIHERYEERARTWSILSNYTVNDGGLDAINDVVACAGNIVAISTNFYIFLFDSFSDLEQGRAGRNH